MNTAHIRGSQDPLPHHCAKVGEAKFPQRSCAHPKGSSSWVGTATVHTINILFLCTLKEQSQAIKRFLLLMKDSCPEGWHTRGPGEAPGFSARVFAGICYGICNSTSDNSAHTWLKVVAQLEPPLIWMDSCNISVGLHINPRFSFWEAIKVLINPRSY